MFLRIRCPNPACGKAGLVPEEHAGQRVYCPQCNTKFHAAPSAEASGEADATNVSEATAGDSPAPELPADSPFRLTSEIPRSIGRFEVRALLGSGAFGTVYRAHDAQLDREVALKVARQETLDSPERTERFLREARTAAKLHHPHIVPVHEAGAADSHHYIASAYIAGRTLAQAIAAGAVDCRRAAAIVRDLAEALAYAHAQGVVHRDVKPANILLGENDWPYLTDFGLALQEDGRTRLTRLGAVLGTPAYMAPEQAAGEGDDRHADQYSLGVVLYELLCGRKPFDGPPQVVLFNIIQREPPAPRSVNPAVPPELEAICLKAMARRPQDRYRGCRQLADALRRWLEQPLPVPTAPLTVLPVVRAVKRRVKPAPRRPGRRFLLVGGLLAGGLLVVLLVVLLLLFVPSRKRVPLKTGILGLHDDMVMGVAFSPDGLRIVSGSADKTVKVWDAVTGKNLFTLRGHSGRVMSVAFSPDGKRIVSGGMGANFGGELKVWDATTGQEEFVAFKGPIRRVMSVAFSPDGKRIVSGGGTKDPGEVKVWDAATGENILAFQAHPSGIWSVAFSPDGKHLVSGGLATHPAGEVKVWDARTGKDIRSLKVSAGRVESVAFSPDGKRIVGGTVSKEGGAVKVWDVGTGENTLTLQGHKRRVISVAFSPDPSGLGRPRIVSGSDDCTIKVWDAATGQDVRTLTDHKEPVYSVACSPDGNYVVSGSADKTVRVWEIAK